MRFRLADLAYPFALFATSVGAFGFGGGVIAFLIVAIFWTVARKSPSPTFIEWLVVAGIILVLIGLTLPPLGMGREQARVATCLNNIRSVALSLLSKVQKDGSLPHAVVNDKSGKPLNSWRVSILPYLDEGTVYDRYDWNEPWSGPKNSLLQLSRIDVLACPSDPLLRNDTSQTNYFAIVGPETAWPEDRGLPYNEITDGAENTILLLEAHSGSVRWSEPRDLSMDEAVELLRGQIPDRLAHHRYDNPGYFYRSPPKTSRGVHAAFADGTVRFLPVPLPDDMAKALLTANAGDEVDWDEFERLTAPQLDYAKIYATIAFAIVALWPARRFLRQRPA